MRSSCNILNTSSRRSVTIASRSASPSTLNRMREPPSWSSSFCALATFATRILLTASASSDAASAADAANASTRAAMNPVTRIRSLMVLASCFQWPPTPGHAGSLVLRALTEVQSPGADLLVAAHPGPGRQRAEALAFGGNESCEIRDRSRRGFDAALAELCLHLGCVDGGERRVHPRDDRLGRSTWRQQAGPVADPHGRKSLFGGGRKLRVGADAFLVRGRDRLQQSGLDLRQDDDARLRRHRRAVRQHGIDAVIAASIGNDGHVDAGRLLEHLGDEMRRAAAAGGRPGDALVAL